MEPDLIFEPSTGAMPPPGSLAELFLQSCCAEDREAWDELCQAPREELILAVSELRRLGWGFSWAVYQ